MYAFSSDTRPQGSKAGGFDPADSEALGQELTTGFAGLLIRRAVYRVCSRLGLSAADREELEQDLRLQLLVRSRQFDPQRAHWRVFVVAVVDRCGRTLCKQLRRRLRAESIDARHGEGLSTWDLVTSDAHNRRTGVRSRDQFEASDLARDVAEILVQLEAALAEFCEKLKEHSVAASAREVDLPRSTFRDRLEKLREIFADHDLDKYL